MRYEFDPRIGGMSPKRDPRNEIAKAVRKGRITTEEWSEIRMLRENLALATADGYHHLCVKLNGQWKDCGIVVDHNTIMRASRGPLVDFHQVWQSGYKIEKPRPVFNGENENECESFNN